MNWMLVFLALCLGLAGGLAAALVMQRSHAKTARELAEELFRESEAQRKAHLETIVENLKSSIGSLSQDALSKSTEELLKLARSKLESEREANTKELDAKKSLLDGQLQLMASELATMSNLIKGLEEDKTQQFGELASQLKTAREQTAALMSNANILADFIETERKRGEEALRESEERFRAIANASPTPLALSRALDSFILYANEQLGLLFGRSSEALIRRKLSDFFHDPVERQALQSALKKHGHLQHYEVMFKRVDGTLFWASVSVQPLTFEGTPSLLWGFSDLTERKRGEEEVRQARALLTATLESTSDGILVVGKASNIVSFNQKFMEMWRVPESVMASRNDNQLLTYLLDQLKDPEKFLAKVRQLYARADAESYDVLEFKDGRLFERYSQPYRLGNDTVGRVWSFRDITERKWAEEALEKALTESEEQLRQSQKLEAIGQLAGGIAHDFNNLLTIITGYSKFLLHSLDPETSVYQDVEEIRKAAKRAADLTQQLLAFSRKQSRQPSPLDLNEVVTGLTRMLQRLLGEDIRLETELEPELIQVLQDPNQIEQVIMNLAVNARDAMPKGGTLTIETANVELDQAYCRIHPGTRPGRYVRLSVRDTGVGMDASTLAHCFEPFFTTKPLGQGTGLGLATVYGIVKQSDGAVDIHSQVGQGTTVKIYLPCLASTDEALATAPASRVIPQGTETILVVEDEGVVRTLIRKIIEQQGYTVLDAVSGPAAITIAAEQTGPIDLLVTDVVMPEMSGPELATLLTASRPDMKVLFLSGYAEDALAHRSTVGPEMMLLKKPFTPEELALKVRDALDTRS
ncbi:MAG: PAS domain S-box protein [Nitrospirae bacterium]|nr:PAS domain S-box protein [Nitrospirota bacterium]